MKWAKQKQSGFTIVELLIVVVVIAILAAITIVAYNGITDRAKASAAQSAASQAAKKVAIWQVDNPGQSPDEATFNSLVGTSTGATYQYTAGSNGVFCLTATANNKSYFTTGSSPTAGGCPGHGQNGVAAITNWATNPSGVGSITGLSQSGSGTAPSTASISGLQYHNGSTSFKRDITGTGPTGASILLPNGAVRPRVNNGQSFTWSFWIYSTKAGQIIPYCDGARVADNVYSGLSAPVMTVPANTWTKIIGTATAAVDTYPTQCGGYSLNVVSGDTVWFDEFMVTNGSTVYSYADGSSSNWVWNGTANASTSTGPPL